MHTTTLASQSSELAAAGQTEFIFTVGDFDLVRELIYQHAGISLNSGKQAMVYSRLSRRLRETGHGSFGSYLQWLRATDTAAAKAEWQQFVNCLTTNLTAFFREEHHFHALAKDLSAHAGRPLRIWCNAASSGEEPYSIAMTVLEVLGPQCQVSIVATDIDTHVLATARRGVYELGARGLSSQRQQRFFLRGSKGNTGLMRVGPELARMVEFKPFNLISRSWPAGQAYDIVFCRNVMIYFDGPTQRQVLQQMHGVMQADGLLYVGHSENFSDARQWFHLRGQTIYQRV